jgi:hypothetical protein
MGEWRYNSTILDLGTASRLCQSTPGEFAPDTHWTGDWVDPGFNLDVVG